MASVVGTLKEKKKTHGKQKYMYTNLLRNLVCSQVTDKNKREKMGEKKKIVESG